MTEPHVPAHSAWRDRRLLGINQHALVADTGQSFSPGNEAVVQHYRRLFIDRGQRGSQKSSEVARQWIASERGNSMRPISGFDSGEVL
jgi:hypothetical protein